MKLLFILGLFSLNVINYNSLDLMINESINNFINEYNKIHYYKNESIEDIIIKINKGLNSTLKNKGKLIVEYSLSKNVNPYLATAIILQETGCKWNCSKLVKECNNVGGNKGKPSCNGGSYRKFNSLDEGIKYAINNLSRYYNSGLITPEQIGKKYASDSKWANKVNKYIEAIRKG